MQSHTAGIQRLYTEKLSAYRKFISFFRSRDAIRALLESTGVLGPKLRALDAGAGFGTATFALLDALRHRGIEAEAIKTKRPDAARDTAKAMQGFLRHADIVQSGQLNTRVIQATLIL